MKKRLGLIYRKLYEHFGPQHWWPGESPLEVAVGAILTQNTNWLNVEKAIANLKKSGSLSAQRLHALPENRLATLIRPAGYFNIKARRLKNFIALLTDEYRGSMTLLAREELPIVRARLLGVNGIGPETADSIILYGLGKPIFVVDAYTKRALSRHTSIDHEADYHTWQALFHRHLEPDVRLYNEYHALIVRLAKEYCRPRNPLCSGCPLERIGLWSG